VLTVATAVAASTAAAPLELLALGLGGLAVVVAVGSALAAYGSRRALQRLDEQADEPARR
jgi:membrane protein implicated in regulation of membrane protease activity